MENVVVGLDVGTTKICTVVARPLPDGRLEVLGVGVVPSLGLKRGVVVDIEDAVESIRRSVQRAQESSQLDIRSAYVGVTGDHLSSLNVVGRAIVSAGTEVTAEDCQRVLQAARDNVGSLAPNREIVHVIPREFSLDGQPGIQRPVGMSGRRLEVAAHVVTGVKSILDNVEKCVEAVGVQVLEKVLEPVATAQAVLTEAERELGVALIDVGGGTADLAIFMDGSICHTSAIPVAGNHVTRDLAIGLRVPTQQAEELKRKAGVALAAQADERQHVGIRLAGTGEPQQVPRRLLGEIIQARLDETFAMIREDLKRSGFYDLIGGAVLTGGGSLLPGTLDLASRALDDNRVRLGEPRGITGLVAPISGAAFGTSVGLAMYGAARLAEEPEPPPPLAAPPEPWFRQVAAKASDLFRRLIRRQ